MASTGTAGITQFFTTCFLSYSGIVWGWSLEFHRGREEKQCTMRKLFQKLRLCRQHWHQKLAIRSHIAERGPSHSEGRTLQNYRAQEKDEKRSLMQSLCVRDKGRGRGNANGGKERFLFHLNQRMPLLPRQQLSPEHPGCARHWVICPTLLSHLKADRPILQMQNQGLDMEKPGFKLWSVRHKTTCTFHYLPESMRLLKMGPSWSRPRSLPLTPPS